MQLSDIASRLRVLRVGKLCYLIYGCTGKPLLIGSTNIHLLKRSKVYFTVLFTSTQGTFYIPRGTYYQQRPAGGFR